jgi:hypothetical protein
MATKIVTKNSSTAGAAPTATDLVQGELAVNVADKRLYTEDNAGAIVELGTNPSGDVTFQDNGKAIFGAGSDLQIYHDGSDSVIAETGTGNLALWGNNIKLLNAGGTETMLDADPNGAVTLYYNDVTRLATSGGGIDVTGTATMDGLDVDSTTPQIKLNETDVTDENTQFIQASGSFRIRTVTDAGTLVAERMRIDHGTGDISFYEDTGTTAKLFWDASAESLGIGTSSPSGAYAQPSLHIHASGNGAELHLTDGTTGATSSDGMSIFQYANDGYIHMRENGSLRTYINGSERMRIDSAGNVGIGTSLPSSILSTSGTDTTAYSSSSVGGQDSSATLKIQNLTTSANSFASIDFNTNNNRVVNRIVSSHGSTTTDGFLAFVTEGSGTPAERMRIDSAGRVGIGTSSPQYITEIAKTQAGGIGPTLYLHNTADSAAVGHAAEIRFNLRGTEATTRNAAIQAVAESTYGTSPALTFLTSSGDNGSATERMRIDSAGNLLVGTTTRKNSASRVSIKPVGSGVAFETQPSDANGYYVGLFYNNSSALVGSIYSSPTSTSFNTSSDQRLKDNIADADDAGSKIDAIQVRQYDWKADGSHQDYGMIAQELQLVAPEAVSGDADSENMMGVDYSKLVPMLIKEIQSLRNRVAQLETGE